jgi:hypothetical protein
VHAHCHPTYKGEPNANVNRQPSTVRMSIDLSRFRFSVNVPTDIEQVNEILHSFDSGPDEYFCDGAGKRAMFADMDIFVCSEDDYFTEDTLGKAEKTQRWYFFLNTCVSYACLSTYLPDSALPIELD